MKGRGPPEGWEVRDGRDERERGGREVRAREMRRRGVIEGEG